MKPTASPALRCAQIISDVFSPPLMPTYAMILAMWVTPLRTLPEQVRLLATLMVALITCGVPVGAIALMRHFGVISDNAVSVRRQRPLPMTITILAYVGAGWFVSALGAPMWLRGFFAGAVVATLTDLIITLWWKISAHTTALGGLMGLTLWMAEASTANTTAMILFTSATLLTGIVATTRLALGRHTTAQVIAGAAVGCLSVYFSILFITH